MTASKKDHGRMGVGRLGTAPHSGNYKVIQVLRINLAVDGSQDSEIHCFKKGQPCGAGAEQLKTQLSVLDEPTLPDPFQAITNSDIEEASDENTMVLDEDSDVDIEN